MTYDDMRNDGAPDFRFFSDRCHRTRKDRLCDCGRVIPAGAKYQRVTGTEDGKFFTSVRCVGHDPNEPCPYPFPPDPFEPLAVCSTCDGEGTVRDHVCYGGPPLERDVPCPDCKGAGA